jgi:probable phosphoglycerate mutase
MTTVLLLRHGVTDWNEERRIQGWGPVPLNATGREQARAAGEHLAAEYSVDRVVASDLQRTVEAAEEVAGAVDASLETAREWRERGFGVYQGLLYDEVFEHHPEHDATSGVVALDATPETGESMLDLQQRVLSGWEQLLNENAPDDTVVVVTHGGPIYVTLGHVRGQDLVTAIAEGHQGNCALNELRHDHDTGETAVVSENHTGYRE